MMDLGNAVDDVDAVVAASIHALAAGHAHIYPTFEACLVAMAGANVGAQCQWFLGSPVNVKQGDIVVAVYNADAVATTSVTVRIDGVAVATVNDLEPGTCEWIASGTPLNVVGLMYSRVELVPSTPADVRAVSLVMPMRERETAARHWNCAVEFGNVRYVVRTDTGTLEAHHQGDPVSEFMTRDSLRGTGFVLLE